ncbi:MAG: hypothetical protein AAB332_00050 [Planctomycetota bacterium]
MQIDRFTKACLFAMVVLLAILLVKPVFEPRDSYAGKRIEYKAIALPGEDLKKWEEVLGQYGSDGWELVGFPMSNNPHIAVLKR